MKNVIVFGLCALCAGPLVGDGFSQDSPERRTGFTFLLRPANARDEALGATGVATVGSAAAMIYNPAGLAYIERLDAGYSYVDWYGPSGKHVAGLATRLPNRGVIGFLVEEFVVSNIGSSGTADRSDYAVTGAWGASISDRVTLGAALKWLREGYGDRSESAFAFDLGTNFATKSANAIFGLGARNLGFGALGEPEDITVPKQIRAGVLLDLVSTIGLVPFPHRVELAFDVELADVVRPFHPYARNGLNVGAEYTHVTTIGAGNTLGISLRAGQKSSVPMVFGGGFEFRTAGGRGISVDYANRDFSRSMSDHRIHVFSVALNL